MNPGKTDPFRVSVTVLAVLFTLVILKLGAPIFVKIAIAVFFALLISPAVKKTANGVDHLLRKLFKRYRRRGDRSQSNLASIVGTALVLIMALLLVSVFFFLIYGTMSMLVNRKDDMVSNVVHPVVTFVETARTDWIPDIYSRIGMEEVKEVTTAADTVSTVGKAPAPFSLEDSALSFTSIVPTAAGLVGTVTGGLLNTVLITMLTVFMVNGRRVFSGKLRQMDMVTHLHYQKIIRAVETVPRKYLLAKLFTSALTGILIGVGLVIMGFQVDEAFIWAITAMVFNFVPFFGSIAAGLMISLYVMSLGGFRLGFVAALTIVIINNIVSNVIEPSYFGDVLPIGKVTILLCVIIWGYLWGIVGIFMAVPVTIIVKVLLEETIGRNSLVVFMEV